MSDNFPIWTIMLFVLSSVLTSPPISIGLFGLPSQLIYPATLLVVGMASYIGMKLDKVL